MAQVKATKSKGLVQVERIVRPTRFSLGASIAIERAHRGLRVISQKEIDEMEGRAKHHFAARQALGISVLDASNPQKQAQLHAYLEKHPYRSRATKGGAR